MNYGLTERQMRRMIKLARKAKTNTGLRLLELLESRMDNIVFRAGFAPTIPSARQLVNHGHFKLNGRKTDIASARVKSGDVISVKTKSVEMQLVVDSLAQPSLALPDWLQLDPKEKTVTILDTPDSESVPFPIDVQQVIEYYNSRI
jgi:small subunit ribosomal protein S4